jgi:hypothetical protein
VVNREEQPVDLRQATRMVPPSPDTTATVAANGTAQGGGALGLGEPKRVRTLTIRPDGTVVGAPPAAPAAQAAAGPATMTLPAAAATPPAPTRVAAATPTAPAPRPTPATPSAPTGGASPQAAAPATPVQAPAAPTAPQRVASAGPASVAAATAPAASEAPVGGFSVQIGVRNSEGDARAAFSQMQQKYAELGGQPALIRKAEVNGSTIYRVRVGPMSKEDASSLCTKLQGSGGQCFVAKN